MSELYNKLLEVYEAQVNGTIIYDDPVDLKPCHVCGESVTTADSFIIEARNSDKVYYLHQKCLRRRSRRGRD